MVECDEARRDETAACSGVHGALISLVNPVPVEVEVTIGGKGRVSGIHACMDRSTSCGCPALGALIEESVFAPEVTNELMMTARKMTEQAFWPSRQILGRGRRRPGAQTVADIRSPRTNSWSWCGTVQGVSGGCDLPSVRLLKWGDRATPASEYADQLSSVRRRFKRIAGHGRRERLERKRGGSLPRAMGQELATSGMMDSRTASMRSGRTTLPVAAFAFRETPDRVLRRWVICGTTQSSFTPVS